MTHLNSSHEWYTVSLAIGHPATIPLNDSVPWITMKYLNDVSGDIQRRTGLCGAANSPFFGGDEPCELVGAGDSQYQLYGMDTRSFLSTDHIYTNSTEMLIEMEIVWPVGAPSIPVYLDQMRVWEIGRGSISR